MHMLCTVSRVFRAVPLLLLVEFQACLDNMVYLLSCFFCFVMS